jgi:hypothetical protein
MTSLFRRVTRYPVSVEIDPRENRLTETDTLDPAAALREPDVAETSPEQPPLALPLGRHAEGAEAGLDHGRIDALPVVRADDLVIPARERRQA